MNQNPWQVDNMAQYERGRVQQEMREIRALERALKDRVRRPSMRQQVWLVILRWFIARAMRTVRAHERRAVEPGAAVQELKV